MNRRLALLLCGAMLFSNIEPLQAEDTNVTYIESSAVTTTASAIVTTGSAITTSGWSVSMSYHGLEKDPRFGFRDKVIITNKGTIEILDDGSIITTGETTYNPKTGDFKIGYYLDNETIFIGGFYEEYSEGIRYGYGDILTSDYTFIYNDEVYAINKGDIYTKWTMQEDNSTRDANIMPMFSFMEIDDKWFLFTGSTFIYYRYTEDDVIDEVVATNRATVQLEEAIEVKDLSSNNIRAMSTMALRQRNLDQTKVLPDGCLLIVTEGRSNWITQTGVIPKDTIINYPNGSVELIKNDMYIMGENVNVRIQNLNGDNSSAGFESYVINKTSGGDIETPPITPTPSPTPSPTPTPETTPTPPPTNNDNDNSSDDDSSADTSQKLNKNKQYEYEVTSNIKLSTKYKTIELVKGDRIILPNYVEKIDRKLPVNTLIIKSNGTRIVLNDNYTMSRRVKFKESKEKYVAFVIYFNYKFYDFAFRLK